MDGSYAHSMRWGSNRGEALEPRLACAGLAASSPLVDNTYLTAWQSDLKDAHARWQLRGAGQTVAVIDSGIAYDHPALGGGFGVGHRVVGGWDFTAENDADPYDDAPAGFHGTHVAGILASDDVTYTGVAPQVDLVALRVFDDQGKSDFRWIEKALRWVEQNRLAFAHPITTVNLSLGAAPMELAGGEGILADEFARLAQAGVFIAVAAGNGFQFDGRAGLNFPATDPSVVPVGSVDGQGLLSRFSRRDPRMLAAPGERITSTITDYLYDFNGKTDDFRAFSGTSQATPQVAGAAVLIREAFLRAGRSEVGQREILDVMRRSAGTVVDPTSGLAYARLDLGAALDLVLPDDDSSSPDRATPLSVGLASTSFTGRIERPGDQDYFTFVAPQRGYLHAEMRNGLSAGRMRVLVDGTTVDLVSAMGVLVNPGQRIVLAIEGNVVGDYSGTVGVDLVTDLGDVAFLELEALPTQVGDYRLETVADGWLTLVASDPGHPAVNLQLRDGRQNLVWEGTLDSGVRWDARVRAGEEYWLRVIDPLASRPRLLLANLVAEDELGGWTIDVPSSTKQVDVRLDDGVHVTLDGRAVPMPPATPRSIRIRQHAAIRFALQTARRGESLVVREDRVEASNGWQRVIMDRGTRLEIQGRPGYDQRVQLHGSPGPDRYRASAGEREFSSATTKTLISAVDGVYLFGGGGDDLAQLQGSSGSDVLLSRDAWTRLVTPRFLDEVSLVTRIEVNALEGYDRASLAGTAGDDTLVVRSSDTSLTGPGRSWSIRGFEKLQVTAGSAGSDRAFLHGTRGSDWFTARAGSARLGSDGFLAIADDFDRVFAYGDGGWDTARLYGTGADDWLRLQTRMATIGGRSGVRGVVDFDEVYTDAGELGLDTVFAPEAVRAEVPPEWNGEWLELVALGIRWSSRGFDRWQAGE